MPVIYQFTVVFTIVLLTYELAGKKHEKEFNLILGVLHTADFWLLLHYIFLVILILNSLNLQSANLNRH